MCYLGGIYPFSERCVYIDDAVEMAIKRFRQTTAEEGLSPDACMGEEGRRLTQDDDYLTIAEHAQDTLHNCSDMTICRKSPKSTTSGTLYKKVAATYSPTWWGSTIGDGELNFSVRNGKRWILTAITATICF